MTNTTTQTFPASYWNGTGTHQAMYKDLRALIPMSGPVENARKRPALERLRKATNAYHDLFSNGGVNRTQAITAIFGAGTMRLASRRRWAAVHEHTEPVMDRLVAAAHAEVTAA